MDSRCSKIVVKKNGWLLILRHGCVWECRQVHRKAAFRKRRPFKRERTSIGGEAFLYLALFQEKLIISLRGAPAFNTTITHLLRETSNTKMKFFSCCRWTFMDIQKTIKASWGTISILNCFPTTVHLKSLEVQPSNQACVEFEEMHPLFSTTCITHPPLSDFLPQLFNIFANCLQLPLALGQLHFRILTREWSRGKVPH